MKAPIVPYCTDEQFFSMTSRLIMRPRMLRAMRSVLVKRKTWRDAAGEHGVTQSGLLKAMRRLRRLQPVDTGGCVSRPGIQNRFVISSPSGGQ